jgi:hypothetical protein
MGTDNKGVADNIVVFMEPVEVLGKEVLDDLSALMENHNPGVNEA